MMTLSVARHEVGLNQYHEVEYFFFFCKSIKVKTSLSAQNGLSRGPIFSVDGYVNLFCKNYNSHIVLTFDKVHNPWRLPHKMVQ